MAVDRNKNVESDDSDWHKHELSRLRRRAKELRENGASGMQIVTYLSDRVDRLILHLVGKRTAGLPPELQQLLQSKSCIIAVGGTGRGGLAPFSDVDLLFLYEKAAGGPFSELTSEIVRDCWDCKIKLGQSLHTISDAITTARQDIQFATATVESRLLWGSEDLFTKFQRKFGRKVYAARLKQFVLDCMNARQHERDEQGGTTKQLEPDVKRSTGGLRDLHLIRWIAFAHYGVRDFDSLRSRGVINGSDSKALMTAREFLTGVRLEMHLNVGRAQDVLTRDEQLRITTERGIVGKPGRRDVERFMQQYLQHASNVSEIAERFARRHIPGSLLQTTIARLTARKIDDHFTRSSLGIDVIPEQRENVCSSLELLLKLYEHCLKFNLQPVPELVELIRFSVPELKSQMTHSGGRSFRRILRGKGNAGQVLRNMYQSGILELVIPEMSHVRGLLQFNQYHHYTVDEHTFRAVEALRDFENDSGPVGDEWRESKHKATLTLAVLLHDIGKGYEEDHSQVGARIARDLATRWQMSENKANMLEFLVLKHLKMSHLAFRRDISDMKLLSEFAHEVGRPELLRMLYILTVADIKAVGPGAWTEWKASLLNELYNRAMTVLGGAPVGQLENDLRDDIHKQVADLIKVDLDSDDAKNDPILNLLSRFPTHYLVDRPAEDVVEDLQAVRELDADGVDVNGHYNGRDKTVQYRVIAAGEYSKGCFHRIAGALTANRMTIVDAKICTTENGTAVDSFAVIDKDFAGEIPEHRIDAVCNKLRSALKQTTSIEAMFRTGQRFGAKANQDPISDLPIRVVIDNDASEKYTIIDVFAHDRPGLLYMVTRTLHRLKLNVALAKIATHLDQALDVFYVTDLEGNKVPEGSESNRIREVLMGELTAFVEIQKAINT